MIQDRLQAIWEEGEMHPICISFLTDGLIGSIKRWLLKKDCMPAREFILTKFYSLKRQPLFHSFMEK